MGAATLNKIIQESLPEETRATEIFGEECFRQREELSTKRPQGTSVSDSGIARRPV